MIKIVLDTNVLISATFWRGPSNEITLLASKQKISCFTSIEIIEEYARILKRDFKQEDNEIEEKVNAILLFSQIVKPIIRINAVKDDPADNKILEAALAANADYIVSGDRHLIKLEEFKETKILKAKQFLEQLGKRGRNEA